MLAAERCLLNLLSEYREELEKLKGIRPTTPELDTTAFAILLLCTDYKLHLTKRSEIVSLLKDSQSMLAGNGQESSDYMHVSSMPLDWTLSDQFPFCLAEAILTFENPKVIELAVPSLGMSREH